MRLISCRSFFPYRRIYFILPVMIGLVSLALIPDVLAGEIPWYFPILLLAVGILFFIGLHVMYFELMDAVWDDGQELLVRRGKMEERFPVSNIESVSSSRMTNPDRVTLSLHTPCRFGSEISFAPPFRFFRFTAHPIAQELKAKIGKNDSTSA